MESLFGSSTLGSAATEAGASSAIESGAASSSLADFAGSTAAGTDLGATAGSAGTLAGGTGEFAGGVTAADLATPTGAGTDFGLAGGTGGTLAGGTGEFSTGVTASDVAQSDPSLWSQITSAYNAAQPYINTAGKVLQVGNMLKSAMSGAGTPATGSANTPSPAPATVSTPASQNQMTRDDYIKQQEAYWQNLLAAQGNILPGNQLPPNIQDAIRRQASMYPA